MYAVDFPPHFLKTALVLGFDVALNGVFRQILAHAQNGKARLFKALQREPEKGLIIGFLFNFSAVFQNAFVNFKKARVR